MVLFRLRLSGRRVVATSCVPRPLALHLCPVIYYHATTYRKHNVHQVELAR